MPESSSSAQCLPSDNSLMSWHRRLAHPNLRILKMLLKAQNIKPLSMDKEDVVRCSVCVQGKMHRCRFTSRSKHCATEVGGIIHSDLASFPTQSREGFKYYVSFIDDYSKVSLLYLLKLKSQMFSAFQTFRVFFENHTKTTIKCFCSDNGGKFVSNDFSVYLNTNGIQFIPGPPHTPELNGVAERFNRTVGERIRCLLLSAGLPDSFWGDALRFLIYLWNSIPCSTAEGLKAPNEVANLPLLKLSDARPFGCCVWYKVPEAERNKLSPKARAAVLLLFLSHGNGFVVWDLGKRRVIRLRDVIFDEETFSYKSYGAPQVNMAIPPVDFPMNSDDQCGLPSLIQSSTPPEPQSPPVPPCPPPVSVTYDESPPLDIPLDDHIDWQLSASIHNRLISLLQLSPSTSPSRSNTMPAPLRDPQSPSQSESAPTPPPAQTRPAPPAPAHRSGKSRKTADRYGN